MTATWLPPATLFPRRRCHRDPPPAAATAILGHTSKHGHFPLDTRTFPEDGWGGTQRSGLREGIPALVTQPQAQGSSSPSHPSLPESWDISWETQPSGSRHKERDFSLLLAWALGTEHLSMRASRKFGWQTSKEGKYICPNTKEEALDGSREGTARDARLAGDSSVPGPSGHPCSWQPGAPYSTTLFCLDGLEADASTSLPPVLRPQTPHPCFSAFLGLLPPAAIVVQLPPRDPPH